MLQLHHLLPILRRRRRGQRSYWVATKHVDMRTVVGAPSGQTQSATTEKQATATGNTNGKATTEAATTAGKATAWVNSSGGCCPAGVDPRLFWCGAMPRTRSAAATELRRLRAVARGFLTSRVGSSLIAVSKDLLSTARTVVQSLELHRRHDSMVGVAHHHARQASLVAHQTALNSDTEARGAALLHRVAGRLSSRWSGSPACSI